MDCGISLSDVIFFCVYRLTIMPNLIFDKTDKGREEIATRKYHLAPRLRTMLLLFDGKNSSDQVLQKVAGLGLDTSGISGLLEQEMIHQVSDAASDVTSDAASEPVMAVAPVDIAIQVPEVAPRPSMVDATLASIDSPTLSPETPSAARLETIVDPDAATAPERDTQFESVYKFFSETIKKTIGLRGFALQLKVERASTIDDFRALRDTYVAAVLNAHGPDVARDIGERLDLLLRPAS